MKYKWLAPPVLLLTLIASSTRRALAEDAATAPDVSAPQKPAPYSLPFQLRPAIASTVIRADAALAFYEDPISGKGGTTLAPMLLASYKIGDHFAPLVRIGAVSNSPPAGPSGFGFLNPVLGGIYALSPTNDLRLAFFLGVTVPVGSGGGDAPDPGKKAARTAGIWARSAMDNAMFAVDDLTIFPGIDLAFVKGGFTAQVEATVFQLTRVRGATDDKDASRTNFTGGVHLGYFFAPFVSAGVELRHQRWLSTPKQIAADKTDTFRDTTTIAFGPRFHIKLGATSWFRPALAFALPLDDPMKKNKYEIFQLDLPFVF